MSTNILKTALAALKAGISVIPIEPDGSKAPIKINGDNRLSWSRYTTTLPTEQLILSWFEKNNERGVAVIGGKISGNLDLLDFDSKETYGKYKELAFKQALGSLISRIENGYKETTPKGVHWLFRCPKVEGSIKLARRGTETLIETKGSGYVIIAPSNGKVHPTGGKYELVSGSLETIVTITEAERNQLFDLARLFDEAGEEEYRPPRASQEFNKVAGERGLRVGDDFNARNTWESVLVPHGWRKLHGSHGKDHWQRPGKGQHEGASATVNFGGIDKLYVFSSAASPFQASHSYSKFEAITYLDYHGDFIEAAKDLSKKGYGSPATKPDTKTVPGEETPPPENKKLDIFETLGYAELIALPPPDYLVKPFLLKGYVGCVFGATQTAKSFWALMMCLILADQGFNVLYLAGENSTGYGLRLKAWYEHNCKEPNKHFKLIRRPLNFLDSPTVDKLILTIKETFVEAAPVLIVVDTLSKSYLGGDENDSEDMRYFVASCERLRDAFGSTILVNHHSPKSGGTPRGSSVIEGDFDILIEATKDGSVTGEKRVTYTCIKQKDAPGFDPVTYKVIETGDHPTLEKSCILEVVEEDKPQFKNQPINRVSASQFKILEVIGMEIFASGVGPSTIMEQLGIVFRTDAKSKSAFIRDLNKLLNSNYITQERKGKNTYYTLTAKGRDIVCDDVDF